MDRRHGPLLLVYLIGVGAPGRLDFGG